MFDQHPAQFARLCSKLVVPIAVGDILINQEPIDGDMHYALHETLSDMDPDTALLAISVSALQVTAHLDPNIPLACALKIEAEKMLEEYGKDWLSHSDGKITSRDGEDLFDALTHIPEDLEGLADLLDTLDAGLHQSYGVIKDVAGILSVQARAHSQIAEFILSELDGADIQTTPHLTDESQADDNVILFPRIVQ